MPKISKKKIILALICFLTIGPLVLNSFQIVNAQTEEDIQATEDEFFPISIGGINDSNGVNCFDYYQFGSIEINLIPDKTKYTAGETAKFEGFLKNNNDYPMAKGDLFIQIFRENSQSADYGNDLVDEFFALSDIYLTPFQEKNISFEWKIPEGLSGGSYFLNSHFVVDKKMNLAGLSFVEGIYGGKTSFAVEGAQIKEIIFDRAKITINGRPFYGRNFIPQISAGEEVKINFVLKNLSSDAQNGVVSKKLFRWDNLLNEQIIKEGSEEFQIASQASKTLNISYKDLSPGIYLFEAVAKNGSGKSILKVRFAVNGDNPPARINFAAINKFPLKQGEPAFIFSCFHSVLDTNNSEGKITLVLKDEAGNTIDSVEYEGTISPQIMAIKKDFTPQKDYKQFWVETTLYDNNGNIMDKTSLFYDCSKFNETEKISINIKNGVLDIKALNPCDVLVQPQPKMALEIYTQDGELAYFDSSFQVEKEEKLEKLIELKEGETYKIKVVSSGKEEEFSYTPPVPSAKLPTFLILILAIILVVIIIFLIRKVVIKKPQKTT